MHSHGEREDLEGVRGFSVGDSAGTKREGGKEDPWGGGIHKQCMVLRQGDLLYCIG